MLTKEQKVIMGVSMPRALKEQIDEKRGDIPRSKLLDIDQQIKELKKCSLNNSAAKAGGCE
jgi:hypothetical protein